GNVYSPGHVELASKAVVNGNVHYHLIEMVMGSEVNGSLVHDQSEGAALQVVQEPGVTKKNKGKDKGTDIVASGDSMAAKPS
ncbi:MAG: polymer-forming cytoskeletal protein, partial [Pseudomonadales bacterium]|nr:polymer-forming cytoskeletal protein [Pseudomonadales bacterium]